MTALETIAAARESLERSRRKQIDLRRNNPKARTIPQEIGDAIRRRLEDLEWEKTLAAQVDERTAKQRAYRAAWKARRNGGAA